MNTPKNNIHVFLFINKISIVCFFCLTVFFLGGSAATNIAIDSEESSDVILPSSPVKSKIVTQKQRVPTHTKKPLQKKEVEPEPVIEAEPLEPPEELDTELESESDFEAIEQNIETEIQEEIPPEEPAEEEKSIEEIANDVPTAEVTDVESEETVEEPVAEEPTLEEPIEEEPVEEEPAMPQEKDVSLPLFGDCNLLLAVDADTQQIIFRGSPKQKNYNLGILTIKNPVISYSTETDFQAEMEISFLGQKSVKVVADKIAPPDELSLSFVLPKSITIPLTPWSKITIKTINLEFNGSEKKISTSTTLFSEGKPKEQIEIVFVTEDLSAGEFSLQCSMTNLSLSTLIPKLNQTPFKNLSVEQAELEIKNPRTPQRSIFIAGIVDFTKLTKKSPIKASKLSSTIKIEGSNFDLEAKLHDTVQLVPNLLTLKNIRFLLSHNEQTSFMVEGDTTLTLPHNISATATMTSEYKDNKFSTFTGTVQGAISFANISIKNVTVLAQQDGATTETQTYSISLTGNANILNIDVIVILNVVRKEKTKTYTLEFEAHCASEKPVKPFEKIPGVQDFKFLKDIEVSNISVGIDTKGNFYTYGKATLFGIKSTVFIIKAESGIALKVMPEGKWQLSDIIPPLKKTVLNSIEFKDAFFMVSSAPFIDPETKQKMPHGLGFSAEIAMSECAFLKPAAIILRDNQPRVIVVGAFGTELSNAMMQGKVSNNVEALQDFILQAHIPIEVQISDSINIKNFILEIAGGGPSVSYVCQIDVAMEKDKPPLLFSSRIRINPDKASVAGTMEGTWEDPFGLKGLTLSDVALEMGIEYPVFASTGLPSVFGMAGTMIIGETAARMAVKTGVNVIDAVALGEVNKLSLNDILALAKKLGLNLAKITIPNLEFRDVSIKLAKKATTIGELRFEPGTTMRGKMMVFDKFAMVDINVNQLSVTAKGSMSELKIGPLLITGEGFDRKEGTADDGPTLDMKLTPLEQYLFLSGTMSLFGSKCQTKITMGLDDMELTTQINLANLFKMDINGKSVKSGLPGVNEFILKGECSTPQTLLLDKQDLIKAQNHLNAFIDASIQSFKDKITAVQKQIDDRHETLMKTVPPYKLAYNAVQATENKVKSAREWIESCKSRMDSAERELKRWGFNQRINTFDRELPDIFSNQQFWAHSTHPYDEFFDYNNYYTLESTAHLSKMLLTNNVFNSRDYGILYQAYDQPETILFASWWNPRTWYDEGKAAAEAAARKAREAAEATARAAREAAEAAARKAREEAEAAARKAKEIAEEAARKAREIAEFAAKKAKAAAEYAATKAAYEAAKIALTVAEKALEVEKENLKNADPVIIAMRVEQAALLAKLTVEQALLQKTKLFLELAIKIYPNCVAWLLPFEIKKISLEGSTLKPNYKFEVDARIFGKFDIHLSFSTPPADIAKVLRDEIIKHIGRIKELVT